MSDCEELVGVTHRGRWIWFYKVSFFKRIGKAGTKIKGIEENDNGQGNRSMVNWGLRYMEKVNECGQIADT